MTQEGCKLNSKGKANNSNVQKMNAITIILHFNCFCIAFLLSLSKSCINVTHYNTMASFKKSQRAANLFMPA